MLTEKQWNPKNESIRQVIWSHCIKDFLKTLHIKSTDEILECYLGEPFHATDIISTFIPEGTLSTLNLAEIKLRILNSKPLMVEENAFDIIFGFFQAHLVDSSKLDFFLKTCFEALEGAGRLIITFPVLSETLKILLRHSLKKMNYSDEDIQACLKAWHYDTSITNILKEYASNSKFSCYNIGKFEHEIELPNIYVFERLLTEISFFYNHVLPEEKNQLLMSEQVKAFEALCRKEYQGKYIFKIDLKHIILVK